MASGNWPAKIGGGLLIVGTGALCLGLLVAAAIKLLLLDFGSLGQLANILAVIAAEGVFPLGVSGADAARAGLPSGDSPDHSAPG